MNNTQNNVSGILSVVMPAYNEENSIEQIVNLVLARPEVGELIIVNDASTDNTWEKLQVFKDNPIVKLINIEKNQGKGYSLRHLVTHASGDYQVYTDGDFPFGEESVLNCFRELLAGADVVMGRRNNSYSKALTPFRKLLSGGLKMLNSLLCGLPEEIQDTQAGLKGFNRTGRELFLKTTVKTFVFDTEFILISQQEKVKIVPVDVQLRPGLKLSSMGFRVMFRELWCFLKVLWKVRIKKSYRK